MIGRRQFLQAGAVLACAGGVGLAAAIPAPPRSGACDVARAAKRLVLRQLATGEELDVTYGYGAAHDPAAMRRIGALLRDVRSGEAGPIDPRLLDALHRVAGTLGVEPVFGVLSAYRSMHAVGEPAGLHGRGRAVDVRLAGIDSGMLAAAAQRLGVGGVGFYRRADFVHLDTGLPRVWRG